MQSFPGSAVALIAGQENICQVGGNLWLIGDANEFNNPLLIKGQGDSIIINSKLSSNFIGDSIRIKSYNSDNGLNDAYYPIANYTTGYKVVLMDISTGAIVTTPSAPFAWGLKVTDTLDFPSTGPHASSDLTVSVPGAVVGDIVQVGSTVNPANSNWSAFVSATGVVTVRYNHYGNSSNDPAEGVFKIFVIKN